MWSQAYTRTQGESACPAPCFHHFAPYLHSERCSNALNSCGVYMQEREAVADLQPSDLTRHLKTRRYGLFLNALFMPGLDAASTLP